jgi:hypothetical protein
MAYTSLFGGFALSVTQDERSADDAFGRAIEIDPSVNRNIFDGPMRSRLDADQTNVLQACGTMMKP